MWLQKARSNTNLNIELDIRIEDSSLKIAPLIFIVFVANAFKFITRDDNTNNFVHISLMQQGNNILFNCGNSFETNEVIEGGIGLANVQRRLELLYKNNYTLNIKKDNNVYDVSLTINV